MTVPTAAFVPRAAAPVVLATVMLPAAMTLIYQPAPAVIPGPVTGWPITRLVVFATVNTFNALAVTFRGATAPVTVPRLMVVPVLVAF